MLWHWVQQDGSKVSTLSFAHNCPCWGKTGACYCISKEEFWIAIQAGQGLLTSMFFADEVSTHTQPWRTKEHDRTVCLQQATLWRKPQNDHSVLTSPPATFSGKYLATLQSHLWWKAAKHFMEESTKHSWQYLSYLLTGLSWSGSTIKEKRHRGHVSLGWVQFRVFMDCGSPKCSLPQSLLPSAHSTSQSSCTDSLVL